MVAASPTWNAGPNGPKNHDELRKKLAELARKKGGKALIADRFTREHIFAGHAGDVKKLSAMLAKYREIPASTLLITSMDAAARDEVLNWITNVPAAGLTLNGTTWTVANRNTAVPAAASYKWATVDFAAYKQMNDDDRIKKARDWLTISQKTPRVACQFGPDGTPAIYHLDY
jgi:hypothetical protein